MAKPVDNSVYAAIQQPAPIQQDGNMATNWREWKSAFEYFLIASGKDSASSKEKCALFMHVIGKPGREILEEIDITDTEKVNYETLCQKFNEYCDPKKNINYERHVFFETYQKDDTFDKFLGSLKVKSKNCEFGVLRTSLILTQLIRGLKDINIKEKLLAKSSLTLEEATQWCRAAERAGQQASSYKPEADVKVEPDAVERLQHGDFLGGRRNYRGAPARGWAARTQPSMRRQNSESACGKCALMHSVRDRCPAFSAKCFHCNRIGHFAKCCRVKFTQEIVDENEQNTEDEYGVNGELLMHNISIDAEDCSRELWSAYINVNGVEIKFKLDSGADASVMSLNCYLTCGFDRSQLKKCYTVLREISKKELPVVGFFDAILKHENISSKQRIYVLNVNCNNLLGLKACVELKLISRGTELSVNHLNFDKSIFEGIGCLPNECNIQIDETVQPVVNATRKIPIKIRPRLKAELDNMEKLGIIQKEDGPTDWVSNIVVVEKPNKSLRVCLDPKNLNCAVKRSHFQLPTLDEISSNLVGAKYFSKCDAKSGFWMLKLNEKSSKLCTFSTPYGRYRFLRMPFGINCAPEIFHREMYRIFKMEGVEVYIDDIMVWGSTKEEHDDRLKEVMRRAKEHGVKFNKEKCVFHVNEIKFLGHIFDSEGMKPDEDRVRAILKMPTPTDKNELERFLGVTNYLSRFIPKYSELSAPLRDLLGKNTEFDWLSIHEKTFQTLKARISKAPVLKYYAPNEPVTVSVDASSHGLGACLLQGGRPVAYAARTLTPTERRWAQIEKELLAITFGCTRFHQYIYGHEKVTVETDHKPLEAIFKKPLNETPARLQRLMLKLQHYCIELQYKPGKLLFIADTLSRAATEPGSNEIEQDVTIHVNSLYENVEASSEMLKKIKMETENDQVLKVLCEYYRKGWPSSKKDAVEIVRPYWDVHSELHVVNGILFRQDRVVMPGSLRKEMLRRIHEGHMGIEKCQRRAREVMWWPGMSADIARVVAACETCQRHRAANPREPLVPHPVPDRPWEVVAADIFELKGQNYLLVVDYYSKFMEITPLNRLYSTNIIVALKMIFSRFGIPKRLVTDNGPQFTSEDFVNFSKSWEFEHVTSSPHYPRSNGLVERNVQTIKLIMMKSQESGEDWQLGILNFRNTPVTGEEYSPAQLLMSRKLRTRLPTIGRKLEAKLVNKKNVMVNRQKRIVEYKNYYDKGTRRLLPLNENAPVRMRSGKVWVNSKVINKAPGERSYWVQTENGNVLRRNRQHLLPTYQRTVYNVPNRRPSVDWENVVSKHDERQGSSLLPCGTGSPVGLTTRSGRIVHAPRRLIQNC